ncbi:hypothetical protein CRG98_043281, partial [Punica granatum]
FAEPARSCLLHPSRVFSPVRVYFSASHVRRACSLVPLATLPGLLTRASLLFCFASSPSLLAPASCILPGSSHPCEFTFLRRMFVEPARSCLLQPCRVSSPFAEPARSCLLHPSRVFSPVRVYFSASHVRRACSLVPLATLPGLLTRASLLFCFASSPSLLAPASCILPGSSHPCEFTFLRRMFVEPARSCLLQPCRVSSPFAEPARSCLLHPSRVFSPVRVYFSASHVRRACSLVPLATLPGLLTRASLLFCFASSPSLLAPASCILPGSSHPCEFTFLRRMFVEPARSCLLQPCRVSSPFAEPARSCLLHPSRVFSPVRVYFSASHVRRACSLVPLATLPGLLTRASLLFCFASSPSLLAPASCILPGSSHPCEFTFLRRMFVEPARSCLLQPCRVSSPFAEPARSCLLHPSRVFSPVRVYFSASHVRRACSLVPLATLPGLLTRASLLFCFASSPSLLAPASCILPGSSHPCEFTFLRRMFVEPARSCLLQPCRVSSPFAEPARSCLLHPSRVFSPVRVYFSASHVRRACSLVPLATLPGLLTRASLLFCFAISPSLLAPASCILPGSSHPCEFTFLRRMFVEPARSCLLQPCPVCSPVRVYFPASLVRRACSLLPLATFPGLLTRASLLSCFASSPSLLAPASCNLPGSAHPCEFTFLLR